MYCAILLQINGITRGSFTVPSESCSPGNHSSLKWRAAQEAIEQDMIRHENNIDRVFISRNGLLVNFVVKNKSKANM